MPVTFTGGVNYENMSENRKGYNNFRLNNGTPEFGHKGDLRRDERNLMWNVDPYLQTQWQLTQNSRWMLACATVPCGSILTITISRPAMAMTAATPAITTGYRRIAKICVN